MPGARLAEGLRTLGYLNVSNDPEFEKKLVEVVGLYLDPPEPAAVFCFDERASARRWTAFSRLCPGARAGQGR